MAFPTRNRFHNGQMDAQRLDRGIGSGTAAQSRVKTSDHTMAIPAVTGFNTVHLSLPAA